MSEIQERLQKLNIQLPPAVKPVGAYAPAVVTGNLVFVSGQLPMRDGKLQYTGKVGRDLDVEAGRKAAELCFLNVLAALGTVGLPLEAVKQVVRLVGHVQSAEGFCDQPQVINSASELCRRIFGERGVHSRAALGAFALPLNAAVELEAIFEV